MSFEIVGGGKIEFYEGQVPSEKMQSCSKITWEPGCLLLGKRGDIPSSLPHLAQYPAARLIPYQLKITFGSLQQWDINILLRFWLKYFIYPYGAHCDIKAELWTSIQTLAKPALNIFPNPRRCLLPHQYSWIPILYTHC